MKIIIFQQFDSAEKKIEGITKYGRNIGTLRLVSIDVHLPEFIDDPGEYFDPSFEADLVLNYLKHPDLSDYLIELCDKKDIPVVSAGKKGSGITPFTCCCLCMNERLG